MPNPGKPNPNYAHAPSDAQRFDLSPVGRTWATRTTNPAKQRTPDRSTQTPVAIGNPDYRVVQPGKPPPTSTIKAKLAARRRKERGTA